MIARLTAGGLGSVSLLPGIGFLTSNNKMLLAGGITAAFGLSTFPGATFLALRESAMRRGSLWSLRLAVGALVVTITLALMHVLRRADWIDVAHHPYWGNTRAAWGLAGWIGLLLAAVAMELIPIFFLHHAIVAAMDKARPTDNRGACPAADHATRVPLLD